MGTHQARIDTKGRVSIPAPFRTELRSQSDSGAAAMVLFPSYSHRCLEGYTVAEFNAITAKLDQLDAFSAEYEAMSTAIYSEAFSAEADKEGRIVLPVEMIAHAGLPGPDGLVTFLGIGRRFQIWEPAAGQAHKSGARSAAVARGGTAPGGRA